MAALAPGLALGGVLSLPGLLPALALDRGVAPETTAEAARIYVFERLPHHLAPATLPADEFARRCIRFGLLVVAFAALASWLSRTAASSRRSTSSGAAPREPANPTPPARSPGARGGPASSSQGAGAGANGFDPQAMRRVMRFAAMALASNCVGLSIELLLANEPLAAARWLRYYWFRQADVVIPAATALAATCLAIDGMRRRRSWATPAAAAVLLLCAMHLVRIAVDRVGHPAPPAVARVSNVEAWIDVCTWIRDHAPPDAVCLIPRHAQSFKWYAHRADAVNWKDIPQSAVGVVEWWRRLADIYPTVDTGEGPIVLGSPEQWGARRASAVALRYGADYIVARSEPVLGLREVYSSGIDDPEGGYAIYVPERTSAADAP
jgi:hypothetical protein